MIRLVVSLLFAVVVVGCKSRPFGPYISPRVTGQVLAADTHLPLAGVKVARGSTEPRVVRGSPPKGGEVLMRKAPIKTDRDGRFVLPGERVLSVIRGTGWDVVSLSFERGGYQRFQTNCPTTSAVASAGGEPVLNVGRIFLQRASK